MKISQKFKLKKSQRELDFVDIDIKNDTPLFINPILLAKQSDKWSQDANATLHSFFQFLINTVKAGKIDDAKLLFNYLKEPKETGLGLSKSTQEGHGMGDTDTERIFEKLINSKAIQTGLVEDIEDTVIFVEKIGPDKVSDMTTNVIRKHLIEYTQRQCKLLNIPLTPNISSGYFWNKIQVEWAQDYTDCLIIGNKRVLLVPKSIVIYKPTYSPGRFHRHYILNFLQDDHVKRNTFLVKQTQRKDGTVRKYVTKKDLAEKEAPFEKEFIRKFTLKHPNILRDYKKASFAVTQPLTVQDFEDFNVIQFCDFLTNRLKSIPCGTAAASEYHDLMIGIFEFLFYPQLVCP